MVVFSIFHKLAVLVPMDAVPLDITAALEPVRKGLLPAELVIFPLYATTSPPSTWNQEEVGTPRVNEPVVLTNVTQLPLLVAFTFQL